MVKFKIRIFISSVLTLNLATSGFSSTKNQTDQTHEQKNLSSTVKNLQNLEVEIWLGSKETLRDLETKVIRVIQENPSDFLANYLLSIYYMQLYKNDILGIEALRRASLLARQTIDLAPKQSLGYVALANIAVEIGQAHKAQELIEKIQNKESEKNLQMDVIRSKVLLRIGSSQQKERHFSNIMNSNSFPSKLFLNFAHEYLEGLNEEDAHNVVKKWFSNKVSPENLFLLGRTQQRLGLFLEANKNFEKAIEEGLNNLDLLIENGLVLLNHLNKPDKAIYFFDSAVKMAQSMRHYSGIIKADINLHKGFAHLQLNQRDLALESHLDSLSSFGSKEQLLQHLVLRYRKLGKPKELIDFLYSVTEEIPGSSISHALLGEVLSEDIKKPSLAVKAYTDAITLSPDKAEYYSGIGIAFYKLKKFQAAADVFLIASELNPEDASAKYNIACMLAILGRKAAAIENLKLALKLDPSLQASAIVDNDFNNLKNDPIFQNLTTKNLAH